jgi:pyrroline-5-carboxylate reductase
MGQALLSGLIAAEWTRPERLTVVEVDVAQREAVAALFPGVQMAAAPLRRTDAVLAVKPHIAVEVCKFIEDPTRVMSIAAGVTIASLEAALGSAAKVIRVMPNTPALVGAGASGVAGGSNTHQSDVEWALGILRAVGIAVEVDEAGIDAVTGLSGSGPAYVFAFADALARAGMNAGLAPDIATRLANQTILGAARLLTETDQTAVELRDMVTTPGGTTEAGLAIMAAAKFDDIISAAVAAATERSRELGA